MFVLKVINSNNFVKFIFWVVARCYRCICYVLGLINETKLKLI